MPGCDTFREVLEAFTTNLELIRLALTLNLGNEPIYTKQEHQHLLEAGVEGSTISYNFLTWRRSCMATTLIPVFLALVISVLESTTGMVRLGSPAAHNGTNFTDIMYEIKRVRRLD